jgi:hypothetical protein
MDKAEEVFEPSERSLVVFVTGKMLPQRIPQNIEHTVTNPSGVFEVHGLRVSRHCGSVMQEVYEWLFGVVAVFANP